MITGKSYLDEILLKAFYPVFSPYAEFYQELPVSLGLVTMATNSVVL